MREFIIESDSMACTVSKRILIIVSGSLIRSNIISYSVFLLFPSRVIELFQLKNSYFRSVMCLPRLVILLLFAYIS